MTREHASSPFERAPIAKFTNDLYFGLAASHSGTSLLLSRAIARENRNGLSRAAAVRIVGILIAHGVVRAQRVRTHGGLRPDVRLIAARHRSWGEDHERVCDDVVAHLVPGLDPAPVCTIGVRHAISAREPGWTEEEAQAAVRLEMTLCDARATLDGLNSSVIAAMTPEEAAVVRYSLLPVVDVLTARAFPIPPHHGPVRVRG